MKKQSIETIMELLEREFETEYEYQSGNNEHKTDWLEKYVEAYRDCAKTRSNNLVLALGDKAVIKDMMDKIKVVKEK